MKFREEYLNESASTNKKIKAELDNYLDSNDIKQTYFDLKEILNVALRDANFSDLIPEVDKVFTRGRNSHVKDISMLYKMKGEEIAAMAKWDANDILDGVAFYASTKLGRPLGEKIEQLKELV